MRFLTAIAAALLLTSMSSSSVEAAVSPKTGAVSVRPKWHELEGYNFARYVHDFSKKYVKGTEEYARREKLFAKKLQEVQKHNANVKATWKAGINHMSDWTEEEFSRLNGNKMHEQWKLKDQLRAKPHVHAHQVSGLPLPPQVDYRNSVPGILSSIKDQGQCGSCWAHGSTETIESYTAMAFGDMFDLSQQQVTACAPNPNQCGGTGGCGGSIIELAWDYVISAGGIAQEWTYPYTAYEGTTGNCSAFITPAVTLTGYTAVTSNSQNAVMDAIAHVGPLAVNVDASGWGMYESGVFTGCNYANNITIDHVVQMVGYGTDSDTGLGYWIIRNSWSPAWGDHGYIKLLRTADGQDCGWDTNPQQGTGCNNGPAQLWACGECGVLFDTLYPVVGQVY